MATNKHSKNVRILATKRWKISFQRFTEVRISKFRFNGQVVETVQSTTYQHNGIYHLASYQGQPLTTGSYKPRNAKTEIMNLQNGKWTSGPNYQFHSP